MMDDSVEFSGPVVSSAHLAAGAMPVLSEFEFGVIMVSHAFERWMVRCMSAAGVPDMSAVDVLVLHTVYHRGKAKRMGKTAGRKAHWKKAVVTLREGETIDTIDIFEG